MAKIKIQKKFVILLIPLGIIVIILVGLYKISNTKTSNQLVQIHKNNLMTYNNSTFGYTFEYPNIFLVASLCGSDTEVVVSTKKVNCDPSFSTDGKLLMWINEYDGDNLQQLLKPQSDLGPKAPTVISTNKISINGIDATKIHWSNNSNEVIIVRNNKTYRLTQLSYAKGDDELFSQIISSFYIY